MAPEILARNVDPETRKRVAVLLERKLNERFEKLDDVIGMLQLMLVADGGQLSDVGRKASQRIVSALEVLISPSVSPFPTEGYGRHPALLLPPGTIHEWQFHEVWQALLPMKGSGMTQRADRERIVLHVIHVLTIHAQLLRMLFIAVGQSHLRRTHLRAYFRAQWACNNQGQILGPVDKVPDPQPDRADEREAEVAG